MAIQTHHQLFEPTHDYWPSRGALTQVVGNSLTHVNPWTLYEVRLEIVWET